MSDDTVPSTDPPERKVLNFGRRSKAPRADGQDCTRSTSAGSNYIARPVDSSPVSPPTDGIILACACGGTLLEMLNGGAIRCARCSRLAPGIYWTVEKGAKPPRGAQ
jgi:hypothetical protein